MTRFATLIGASALLIVVAILSISVGSNPIPLADVARLLTEPDGSFASSILHEQRLPRTILLIVVGAALGVAGALMQTLTRNHLADPGVLGINAGASLAVVAAVAIFGTTSIGAYVWFAFGGAALAAVTVYALSGTGTPGGGAARLALAGIAISMAVSALVQTVILSNQHVFNEFRFWAAGSAEGRGTPILTTVIGFIIVGLVLACIAAPSLNALALGDDTGKALGVNLTATRILTVTAVTLLAGAATAAIGPIMFIGLGVPYVARALCGSDVRWVIPVTMVAAPVVLIAADVLARVVVYPSEVQVGIMTAILGGPVFIALVRRKSLEAL